MERREFAMKAGPCFNCLRPGHSTVNCPSPGTCMVCQSRHHNMLHPTDRKREAPTTNEPSPAKFSRTSTATPGTSTSSQDAPRSWLVLLPTAMVQLSCDDGQPVLVRALLYPCAELTLTSISLARKLRASLHKTAITISGVAGGPMDHARTRTHFHIHTAGDFPPVSVGVYCLQKFNLATPAGFTNEQAMHDWEGLELADPRFGHHRAVDLLLGADVYPLFLRPELLRRNEMMAQRTAFGWIITGRAPSKDVIPTTITCTTLITCPETTWHDKLISLMQRFWELEDLPRASRPSPLDEECEVIFACHQRTSEGRYIVRLPLKQEGLEMLGESLNGALASLSTLHRRLSKDVEMAKAYTCFMTEYVRLGHMRPVPSPDLRATARPTYYIPHHGIWQRGDHHRRLRVVFNASRPTSTGQSLNDTLHTGPKL